MQSIQHRDNLRFSADHYGLDAQLDKTVEELDELKAAIQNRKFGGIGGIYEEMADVYNMLYQIMYLTDAREAVMEIADQKMQRTSRRIKEEHNA